VAPAPKIAEQTTKCMTAEYVCTANSALHPSRSMTLQNNSRLRMAFGPSGGALELTTTSPRCPTSTPWQVVGDVFGCFAPVESRVRGIELRQNEVGDLLAAQAHLGQSLASQGPNHGWNGTGALTPISRFATMFSGDGVQNANGTECYFPQRLTDDTAAVDNGNANPVQSVLGVNATMGHHLAKNLLIYAFGARLDGASVPEDAQILANSRAFTRAT
jgi:hypothetical protein